MLFSPPQSLSAVECAKADVVVSLLPYVFHPLVAKAALKANKHFLTASYVSDGIRALQDEFKAKGLVTINECGVDPGTDHASMRAIVERVHAAGGKITYFTSFAGGLPAPECDDNPFRYKFSWAPKVGRLVCVDVLALSRKGRVSCLQERTARAFTRTERRCSFRDPSCSRAIGSFLSKGLKTLNAIRIAIPNRTESCMEFRFEIFCFGFRLLSGCFNSFLGVCQECKTVIRGTLRNQGWCEKIKKLVDLGYVDETHNPSGGKS